MDRDVFYIDASNAPKKLPHKIKVDGVEMYSAGGYRGVIAFKSKINLFKRGYYFIVFKIKQLLRGKS